MAAHFLTLLPLRDRVHNLSLWSWVDLLFETNRVQQWFYVTYKAFIKDHAASTLINHCNTHLWNPMPCNKSDYPETARLWGCQGHREKSHIGTPVPAEPRLPNTPAQAPDMKEWISRLFQLLAVESSLLRGPQKLWNWETLATLVSCLNSLSLQNPWAKYFACGTNLGEISYATLSLDQPL